MAFTKWETFLENHIEGFFNKKFGSALEPIEVEKKLEKEIANAKRRAKKREKEWILPNAYTILMNEEECHHLSSQRFLDDLHILAEKKVILLDAFMDGKLAINIQKDVELSLGLCRVKASYSDMVQRVAQAVKEQHTIVLQRPSFQAPLDFPTECKIASLTVVEGADLDSYLAMPPSAMKGIAISCRMRTVRTARFSTDVPCSNHGCDMVMRFRLEIPSCATR